MLRLTFKYSTNRITSEDKLNGKMHTLIWKQNIMITYSGYISPYDQSSWDNFQFNQPTKWIRADYLILVNTSLDYFYTSSLKSILLNHCSSLCLLKSFPFSWIWHWTHWGFTTWAISSSSKCIEFTQSSFWHHCRDGNSVFNTLPLATVTIQPIWFVLSSMSNWLWDS